MILLYFTFVFYVYANSVCDLQENNECVDSCSEGKVIQSGHCVSECNYGFYTKLNAKNQEECYEICLAGEYINPDERGCLLCPSHEISSTFNSIHCHKCDPGEYPDELRSSCIPCQQGTFQEKISDDPLIYACRDCPINTYQPGEGQTICLPCVNNTHQPQLGQTVCEDCPTYVSSETECCDGFQFQFGLCIKCAAGTKSTPSGCQECDEGYISEDASTTCEACDSLKEVSIPGDFQTTGNRGGVACSKCPKGRFKIGNTCQNCTLGRYQDQSGSYVTGSNQVGCKACPGGQYQNINGQISCKKCSAGFSTNNKVGQFECEECPADKVSNVGASQCSDTCPFPSYKIAGNAVCQLCNNGQFRENNACMDCPFGKFSKQELMYSRDKCLDCPLGFSQDEEGKTECSSCENNLVALQTGLTVCTTCPVGKQKSNSALECNECSVGFFGDVSGQTCKDCLIGKYQDTEGATSCKDCDSGKISILTGSGVCIPCAKGKYQSENGKSECKNCGERTFSSSDGKSCSNCAAGFYNDKVGQFECLPCRPGWKSAAGQRVCEACPEGQYENDNTCKECEDGSVPNFKGVGSSRCIRCDGLNCQVCPPLYKSANGKCEKCPVGDVAQGTQCVPCKPGVEYNADKQYCTPCEVGKYRFTPATDTRCIECPKGKYQDFTGQSRCKECDYGKYIEFTSRTVCKSCPIEKPITFNQGAFALNNCTDCPTGKYVISQVCGSCITGTFIKNGICENCPSGYESTTQNADSCSVCPTGKAALSGKQCSVCIGYAYQNEEGQESCKTCAVASGSTTGCSSCVAGKYFDADCKECPAGYWSGIRQKECTKCIEGRYQALTSQEFCDKCVKGKYQDTTGNSICKQCEVGKFQSYTGQKTCVKCPAGQFQGNSGRLKCDLCPVGKYSEETGMVVASGCKNCPSGYFSTAGICEKCTEGTYQDYEAQDSCKNCPQAGQLSAEGATSTQDCFESDGLVSYVFNMKEDSKEEQSLTRDCEIRPNLVLLCPGCRCANSARDGFWDGPVCDECQRGYAQSKCKVICPGYDGVNDDTICSGLGSCWFGKNGNGLCFCGGHSKIDKTAENAVVDVRMCSKGEKCNGYGPDYLTESQYQPIYYLMKYRQFSVYVLKLSTYTPKRGHMWFKRWPRAIAYKNDCRQCLSPYDSSAQQHSRTYTGAYDMETAEPTYQPFVAQLQSKNGFHGENCQHECGLCMNGGSCVNVPHPYRFEYGIFNTFERQNTIYVPQTTCVCSSTVYDSAAMCCPKGFQPYIYYGNRNSKPYARYSRTPYLTTIQHTEKTFWIDKDLWLSPDYGTPDYFIPGSKKMYVSDEDQVNSVNYLNHGPFGKHIFYGFEKDLCRPCPGLFGKGIRYQSNKVETPALADFYWWDASFGAERRKCNGIGVCDFYLKDNEPQVKFMGNAQEYILLKKGYICSETPDPSPIYAGTIEECIAQKNTRFIAMVESYQAKILDSDLFSLDGLYPFTTTHENIARRFSKENVVSSVKIQGPAILKFHKQFKQKGKGRCSLVEDRVEPDIDLVAGLSNNQAAKSCAKQCMTQIPSNNPSSEKLYQKRIKGFSIKLGFSSENERFCYCQTKLFSECTLNNENNYIFYEWDDQFGHPESQFEVFGVLKRGMRLPKPDTNTIYTVMPTTDETCRGYDACDLEDLSIKYEISIYSTSKGFGDDRLITSTFDRFDTCFTYTKQEPITIGSYTTNDYVNGEDPFVGGLCPKGHFCTETTQNIGFKEACPPGYYQPKQGQTRTDPNTRCSTEKSTNQFCQLNVATKNPNDFVDLVCIRCPRNTYAPEGSYECKECPSGKVKKLSGVPYTPFKVWNTPNKNQISPWYYVPDEAGTEIEDCALMPAGVIHIPQLNHMLTYDVSEFLPIVTCPYGFSSQRGTFMYTGDEIANSIELQLAADTQEPPYMELKNQLEDSVGSYWKHVVDTYCYQCPGNSITGEDSTRCTTCFANQMKKYMKDVIYKSVTKSELQPKHICCPPSIASELETNQCTDTKLRVVANAEECKIAASDFIIEYKFRASGQCEDEDGWATITTREGCQQAARDLDDISPNPVLDSIAKSASSYYAKGCSVYQPPWSYNGKSGRYNYLRWRDATTGGDCGPSSWYVCICKRIAKKSAPTTGTNAIAAPGNYILNSLQVLKQITPVYNTWFQNNEDSNRPKGCYIDESNQVYFNNKQGTDNCVGTVGLYGKSCLCIAKQIRCSDDVDKHRRAATSKATCESANGEWIEPEEQDISADGTFSGERKDRQLILNPNNLLNIVVDQANEDAKTQNLGRKICAGDHKTHHPLLILGKSDEASDNTIINRCADGCLSRDLPPLNGNAVSWDSITRVYGFIVKTGIENAPTIKDVSQRGRCYCMISPTDCTEGKGIGTGLIDEGQEWQRFKYISQPTPMYCTDHNCLFQEMVVPPSVEMVPADCIILCLQIYGGNSFIKGNLENPNTAIGFFDKEKKCLCGANLNTAVGTFDGDSVDDLDILGKLEYPWEGVRMDVLQVLKDGGDYKLKNENKCQDDVGYRNISDDGIGDSTVAGNYLCNTAASELGLQDRVSTIESKSDRPPGCYLQESDNKVYYNSQTSSTISCSSAYKCICRGPPGAPNWDGLPLCSACQGGTHTLLTGGCQKCPEGKYTADSKDARKYKCKSCPAGYYQPDEKKTSCLECAVGKYQTSTGQITCDICRRGYYQDISASADCNECTLGKYQNEDAQSTCIDCPAGYHSRTGIVDNPTYGLRYVCDACEVGKYTPAVRLQICDICPQGWHSNINGNTSTYCVECESGRFQSSPESGFCDACGAGKYTGMARRAESCKDCPGGWGQPVPEQQECLQCRGGAYCTATSATSCPAGRYKTKDSPSDFTSQLRTVEDCQYCPSGKYSSDESIDCRTVANRAKAIVDKANNCRGWGCWGYNIIKAVNQVAYTNSPDVCKTISDWTRTSSGCLCYNKPGDTSCECCKSGGCQNSNGKCVQCASSCGSNSICEWNNKLKNGISQCEHCPNGWTTDGDVGRSSCEQCHPEGWTINGASSARTFSGSCGTSEWPSRHGGSWFSEKRYKTYVKNEVSGPIKCYIRNSCTTNYRVDYKFKGRVSKWYRGYMGYFNIFGFMFGWMWGGLWSVIRRALSSDLCNRYKYHNKYDSFCSENWGFWTAPGFFSKPAYSFYLQQGETSELVIRHQAGTEWDTHLDLWVDCYGSASHSGTPVSLWTQAPQVGCETQHTYRDSFYHRE